MFVTYEGRSSNGKRFRNTEILTIRDGKIVDAAVYFGWTIPHEAGEGKFLDPESRSFVCGDALCIEAETEIALIIGRPESVRLDRLP